MNLKTRFGNLPVEDRRTMKNERRTSKNGWKSSWKSPQKRYENLTEAPRLGFSSRNQFFSLISSDSWITRRAEQNSSPLLPLFIGKWERCLPPSSPRRAQLAQASKVTSSRSNRLLEESSGGPKWVWLLFAPPLLLNTPLPFFFVILFPWSYENLRIL